MLDIDRLVVAVDRLVVGAIHRRAEIEVTVGDLARVLDALVAGNM